MNLIEPWWKQLKALALKGRRFETTEELEAALLDALDSWNRHRRPYRWRKIPAVMPQTILGATARFSFPMPHELGERTNYYGERKFRLRAHVATTAEWQSLREPVA